MMKVMVLMGLCLLAGCGTYPTLQQLEAEALVTGDWSAVEHREFILNRREQRSGPQCPGDSIKYCVKSPASMRCTCVESNSIYSAFR